MEGGTTEGDSTTDTTGTTGTADAGTGITDADRITLVRASLAKVGRDDLQAALDRGLDPSISIPTPVANAPSRT